MSYLMQYLMHPELFIIAILRRVGFIFSDKTYLKYMYRLVMHEKLNLKHPQKFTEKIQWLKLYDRKPEYTDMVDKVKVKEYVSKKINNKIIIPTLAVYNDVNDLDLGKLPDRFVLKTSNGGGSNSVIICRDKSNFNIENAKKILQRGLKFSIYKNYREWPYKSIHAQIIAEMYMQNNDDDELMDYKFYCFNGRAEYCQVIMGRHANETIDFFDRDWKHQSFYGLNPIAKPAGKPIAKPAALDQMLKIADILSENIPFVRVDLYYVNAEIYFGELTFYPASGLGVFTPKEWDSLLGEKINLTEVRAQLDNGVC